MFTRIRSTHPVTGIVIGVVATLVLSGTAMAITDTSFTYSTVQTGYLMIGPADLVPENDLSANDYSLGIGGVVSNLGACFIAPVHLPQGARMTSVRTSYRSEAASNPGLNLMRTNPVTGSTAFLISRTILDDSDTLQYVNDAVPANLRLVTNSLYIYTYQVCVGGSGDAFYGARIAYQYYTAGD